MPPSRKQERRAKDKNPDFLAGGKLRKYPGAENIRGENIGAEDLKSNACVEQWLRSGASESLNESDAGGIDSEGKLLQKPQPLIQYMKPQT